MNNPSSMRNDMVRSSFSSSHENKQPLQTTTNTEAFRSNAWAVGATEGVVAANNHMDVGNSDDNSVGSNRSSFTTLSSAVMKSLTLHSNHHVAQQQQENNNRNNKQQQPFVSLYQDLLFHNPNSKAVEAVLAAACEGLNFEIAEMWLRTGPKTHQLIHSHVRPTALEEDVAAELVDVYYGEKSCERTHRLSPALCKRAKEAGDVVWVTAHNDEHGALRYSISDVRTAVAVPVCHAPSFTNITLIYFSIKRALMRSPAVEFLVHLSLAATTVLVNAFAEEIFVLDGSQKRPLSFSPSPPPPSETGSSINSHVATIRSIASTSIGGARLDMSWKQLGNVEYLTDGGNNWIHTAVVNGQPVVVKTLKPECQDVALAINELESELEIHAKLSHLHIVKLVGAGLTSKGYRFIVLERLDGGTLSQVLGYDTRIRDRRRRFWKKKHFSYVEVLTHARSLAAALAYLHGRAVPGSMVLHRDLKPDNIGFTLDGTLKVLDFGLARVVENASPDFDEVYDMSGETGSLRYMSPEVSDNRPYNHKADVYSFGIILWELVTRKKPYEGMSRETFYQRVVRGDERPPIHKKWPKELSQLMKRCWSGTVKDRPNFDEIVVTIDRLLSEIKGEGKQKYATALLTDRHSTW
eukprot:CAMPEP_0172437842 /NCGR_PEP_ID=MMETSP1064-20121228/72475_1 /TAXON_ID=202472 /ORGANISM="Aulacoseira subarctica , Strain CCAP 1002/5" /LENGTH=635 /DNA_ID=CAMNT_0013186349 /DNA_START=234 /DNA_END=2138 /DNA_ORIENTATION=-